MIPLKSDMVCSDSLEVNSEPKRRSLKLVIIVVVAIVIVLVAALAFLWWVPQEGTEAHGYYIGTYAEYRGQTYVDLEPIEYSMRIEVVDLNSTHLESRYYVKLQSESLEIFDESQFTRWVRLEERSFGFVEAHEGTTLERTYDDYVYIDGCGTKYCEVFEFTLTDDEGNDDTVIVYVDMEIKWPLKFLFSFNTNSPDENISFEVNLTDTNIVALS